MSRCRSELRVNCSFRARQCVFADARAVGLRVSGETFPERCVMKPTFTAACAALVGLLALSQSAVAQQKTAKQCNDEWTADKAAIQASGKTKRRIRGRVSRRAGGRARSGGAGGHGPIRDRSRGQDQLPGRRRRVGEFDIQDLSQQRQPQLRQDQDRRVHVRKGVRRRRFPRDQDCKTSGNLISAQAALG